MRELLRIADENQQLLKRIETVRPKYDHLQWERDWQTNLQLIDQRSAYQPNWWKSQDQVSCQTVPQYLCGLFPQRGVVGTGRCGLSIYIRRQIRSCVQSQWHVTVVRAPDTLSEGTGRSSAGA